MRGEIINREKEKSSVQFAIWEAKQRWKNLTLNVSLTYKLKR